MSIVRVHSRQVVIRPGFWPWDRIREFSPWYEKQGFPKNLADYPELFEKVFQTWLDLHPHNTLIVECEGKWWPLEGFTPDMASLLDGDEPVLLRRDAETNLLWYYLKGIVFHVPEHLITEAALLVKAQYVREQSAAAREIASAQALLDGRESGTTRRESIPNEVKTFVWNRDQGRCVNCDSNMSLEFDHIIPVAMGGSSSARNLQLLCEGCNRRKGAKL